MGALGKFIGINTFLFFGGGAAVTLFDSSSSSSFYLTFELEENLSYHLVFEST